MTRDEWCEAFLAELAKLRGADRWWPQSRLARAIATNQHDPQLEPAVAARRWHAQNPPAARTP